MKIIQRYNINELAKGFLKVCVYYETFFSSHIWC